MSRHARRLGRSEKCVVCGGRIGPREVREAVGPNDDPAHEDCAAEVDFAITNGACHRGRYLDALRAAHGIEEDPDPLEEDAMTE